MPEREVCGLCRFFLKNPHPTTTVVWGMCRKNPPQIVWDSDEGSIGPDTYFPTVGEDEWCGEFKPIKRPTLQDLAGA